jgi:hypothetical protein
VNQLHVLGKNFLLKHVVEGKIEGRIGVTGRRRKRHKELLSDLNGKGSWKLKEEALDRTVWRIGLVCISWNSKEVIESI